MEVIHIWGKGRLPRLFGLSGDVNQCSYTEQRHDIQYSGGGGHVHSRPPCGQHARNREILTELPVVLPALNAGLALDASWPKGRVESQKLSRGGRTLQLGTWNVRGCEKMGNKSPRK